MLRQRRHNLAGESECPAGAVGFRRRQFTGEALEGVADGRSPRSGRGDVDGAKSSSGRCRGDR